MSYPPVIESSPEQLPSDPEMLHEYLVDIFGRYLFWAMRDALRKTKTLVENPDERRKVGHLMQKAYSDASSNLNPEQQRIALDLANKTMESFAKNILAILTSQGITLRMAENHAIQFSLSLEIRDTEDLKLLLSEEINRNGKKAFMSYWGRWLNQNSTEPQN
jgi:hypothetical protein